MKTPLNNLFYLTKECFLNGHSYEGFGHVIETPRALKLEADGFGWAFVSLPRLLQGEIDWKLLHFINRAFHPPVYNALWNPDPVEYQAVLDLAMIPDSLHWVDYGNKTMFLELRPQPKKYKRLRRI